MAATGPLVTPDELRAQLGGVTADDAELQKVCDATDQSLLPLMTDEDHTPHANCKEAGLAVAVQIWQARHAPGGQMLQQDFGVVSSPHLLSPALVTRVMGTLGPCTPTGGAVVA